MGIFSLLRLICHLVIGLWVAPSRQKYQHLGLLGYLGICQLSFILAGFLKVFEIDVHADANTTFDGFMQTREFQLETFEVVFDARNILLHIAPLLVVLVEQYLASGVQLSQLEVHEKGRVEKVTQIVFLAESDDYPG